MQLRIIVGGVLLASGLLAGCGGTEAEPIEPAEQAVPSDAVSSDAVTREAEAVVWCTDKSWKVEFYAEPELINLVGWIRCTCYQPQARSGTTSNYTKLVYEYTCDLR